MAAATAQLTLLPAIPGQAEADHRQTGDHAHGALAPGNILHAEHRKSFRRRRALTRQVGSRSDFGSRQRQRICK